MRFSVSLLLATILSHGPAYAANDKVLRGPAPSWVVLSDLLTVPTDAGGALFLRRQDTVVHLDDRGQSIYTGYRVRILHPNALELGNLTVAWNPAAGAPVVHAIKIYREGEVIDALQKATFEVLRREDQLEAARLDGVLTAVLRVPDLRVGDELEVGLTTRTVDPTLGNKDSGLLMLAPNPSPGRFHMRLSWDDGQKPNVKMTPDMSAIAQSSDRALDYQFDNPPTLTAPKDAPPRFAWQRIVEYSDFQDWASISRRFAPLFAKASTLAKASPLKEEAKRIAAAHAQPLDRASAALKLVQQNVRYIYVGLDGGNLIPATAEETWQRRYGDCKGKTALLLALLRELGIPAEGVLVSNSGSDDGLDQRLPSPLMFDHVLVRAQVGSASYWLDGTLPAVVPPSADTVIPYQWVLPLTDQGSKLEKLDWKPAQRPDEISLFEIDARTGFDEPARITNTTITRGIEGLRQHAQFSGLTHNQILAAFRQQGTGSTWQMIEDVRWRYDQKAQASVLTITGTGTIDWEDDDGGGKSLALPGGGFNPPERRVRTAEQDQNLPYYNKPEYSCRVTTVRLPTTTKLEQWSHKDAFDTRIFGRNYYRAFDRREGAIRMVRGSRIEKKEITAASAQLDNARLSTFDNSMGWIFYAPSDINPLGRNATIVPATYDMDWMADNVPCLAAP